MEKRSITGRDILRMDGLLPPTRRLPVCDAVTLSDKKREKKWSIGGILKRISSIRDYDSSSNEEEMVYCKREPRNRTVFNRNADGVVLRPVRKNLDQYSNKNNVAPVVENSVSQSADTLNVCRDSVHSRSSDGSLDGLGRKIRKNKLKARAEAKRDRICADSSSDEESRKSCNSLTRFHNDDSAQNSLKTSSCNRKSRAARTERYIKRLSKDEGHGTVEGLNDSINKQNSRDYVDENQRSTSIGSNGLCRPPPIRPRNFITQSNSHTFPVKRSTESLREAAVGLPEAQTRSSLDLRKYSASQYITDLNQNNAYAKPASIFKKNSSCTNHRRENYFSNSPTTDIYTEACDPSRDYQSVNRSACPPEPPPRDPRRVSTYCCYSFPLNNKHQHMTKHASSGYARVSDIKGPLKQQSKNYRLYDTDGERNWHGSVEPPVRRPVSLNSGSLQSCYLGECTNNKHNSTGQHMGQTLFNETEAMKCQRRNNRNEQLNSNIRNSEISNDKNQSSTVHKQNVQEHTTIVHSEPLERLCIRSPSRLISRDCSYGSPIDAYDNGITDKTNSEEKSNTLSQDESLERKRSSKNLEEALSELEAIYNSLRLGDEDLLDRAERRSMEEFSLRRGNQEDNVGSALLDSSDRTKDDMAYRRMHPKERPTSLSEVVGQSALSNISYLMASPILSRKDVTDDYLCAPNYQARRDEPDVTRDDVVYRSIHHANNTLRVIDPQPPFGIPLGPVTTATESDYLHTKPTKPDHPRSSYIPQCEPDIVTDDLAYRTLRKDASTTKNAGESKSNGTRDGGAGFGMKKKRAVRSLSANLYGLINHDRIHLRREPSLQEITDEFNDASRTTKVKPFSERSECFRRVVSDGELSDYDTRWRIDEPLRSNIDINGNHPTSGLNKKKLRVFVSPSTKAHSHDKEGRDGTEVRSSAQSDASLSLKAFDDEFWQDYLQTESNSSPATNKDTESDFTAYSRLCQDLVNLIKGPDDAETEAIKAEEVAAPVAKQSPEIDDPENNSKNDEPSVLHIQSLGSQYSEPNNSSIHKEIKDVDEKTLPEIVNFDNEDSKKDEDNTLDFYLRLADENVKLIAEAFSSVADHLRDSRLSQKNSLSPPRRSEIENDSTTHDTSTRSSLIYSQDDVYDEQSSSSRNIEKFDVSPKQDSPTIIEEDHFDSEPIELKIDPNIDAELDLSRAVHDLQVAAASLCRHEKEIEELETRFKKERNDEPVVCANNPKNEEEEAEEESLLTHMDDVVLDNEEQEQERDQGETVVSAGMKELAIERDPDSEGESTTECRLICKSYNIEIARSAGMRVSYVTNLITVMITAYSMVLLACFLALLLATVAAS